MILQLSKETWLNMATVVAIHDKPQFQAVEVFCLGSERAREFKHSERDVLLAYLAREAATV